MADETVDAAEPTEAPAKKTAAKKTAAKKTTAKKAVAKKTAAKKTAAKKTTTKKAAAKKAAEPAPELDLDLPAAEEPAAPTISPLFQVPDAAAAAPVKRTRSRKKAEPAPEPEVTEDDEALAEEALSEIEPGQDVVTDETEGVPAETAETAEDEGDEPRRRRRRRGGRRRRKSGGSLDLDVDLAEDDDESDEEAEAETADEESSSTSSRRRRRRRRAGEAVDDDDAPNVVTKVRAGRSAEDQITAVSGSTRLEAKKQRRREGREAGRRRAPIVSEAEFLARRESVERVMVIRQRDDLTQIGVLEDKVLVEHYVARESQTSLIGNVYLGRVQNVLPSMEAAFVDIGKGRNAVLYAGEVNWAALGHREGQPRKIESVLTAGQPVLVQVTKDPVGHKGARLTSQISLAGRFLVYVPDGTTSGISRKLPDTERNRLKTLLKEIVPDTAGVIVRTAAEGASEDELTHDVERLRARWEDIESKSKSGNAPKLLYGEPDLTLKVVRDLFTEDFAKLVIQGDDAWDTVKNYVDMVAPDLAERLEQFVPGENGKDLFQTYRVDEQIAKGLDRKVWLPSGGSLIIDRTEAMTVIDVNTGKFTGSGGNLEETVTKNNLEAAEEIVRQLRLRDIGGIIVVDFIDMVLESNRDLVLRRLVECLGRDRTRHQVAEVTSLGLVQMTRKRIGTGLLEAFSETCEHCRGRGVVVHDHPVDEGKSSGVLEDEPRRSRRGRGRGRGSEESHEQHHKAPTPAEFAAMARHEDEQESESIEEMAEEAAESIDLVVEPEPEETLDVEAPVVAVEEAPVAEAPAVKVVTRTRRRGASRPAGAPEGEAAAEPEPAPEPEPAAEVESETEAQAAEHDEHGHDHDHVTEHVPIKKKGSRKR